jgi:hypothetical protein
MLLEESHFSLAVTLTACARCTLATIRRHTLHVSQTLDIKRESSVVNVSFGATRELVLRGKRGCRPEVCCTTPLFPIELPKGSCPLFARA